MTQELCHSMRVGKKPCCGNSDRTDKWFIAGRRKLMNELNVKRLIRSMREFENYMKQEVPAAVYKKIKIASRKSALLGFKEAAAESSDETDHKKV